MSRVEPDERTEESIRRLEASIHGWGRDLLILGVAMQALFALVLYIGLR